MAKSKKKTPSLGAEIVRRLKGFVDELEQTDDIAKQFTCRTVRLNMRPATFSPQAVKQTRRALKASQTIFAEFLGVSPATVRDWEQGAKPPGGAACRLMDEIRCNPEYFLRRLKELSRPVEAS
jgi:putative transcriptional regulator